MRNRLLDYDGWLPKAHGSDGAWLNMPKRSESKKGSGFASKEHEAFAARFAQELAKWLAAEPGRTKRQFAEFCGTDDRTIQRWESEGVGVMEVSPGSILGYASGFLGVKASSWWQPNGLARVPAVKSPSPYDADIAATLVVHARREAFVNAVFRKELQELLDRHKNQG